MGPRGRFIALVAIVSALLPLGAALVIGGGGAIATVMGTIAATIGLLGLVILARAVYLIEHRRAHG